ncbi:MAG: hypothetical protein G8237_03730 [Magnetococcales bacterium]|nr:hypothetical protein [Magnetococcales bacterium]
MPTGWRWDGKDLILTVRVQPRAARERIVGFRDETLQITLTAPPVDGAANGALLRLLSRELEVAASRIRIVQGEHGRNKVVRVTQPNPDRVNAWLDPAGSKPSLPDHA